MPSIDFRYVPTKGSLSGKSFEEQTEQAFNELGQEITDIQEIADNAFEAAENAVATAGNALTVAEQANVTANDAKQTAETALNESQRAIGDANSAITTANEALNQSGDALSAANEALGASTNALATAGEARTNSIDALDMATEAKNSSKAALDLVRSTAGIYITDESTTALDGLFFDPAKLYLTNSGIEPSPLAAPAYLDVFVTSDSLLARQIIANANAEMFTRSADIKQNFYSGTAVFNIAANAGSGEVSTGIFSISHDMTEYTTFTFDAGSTTEAYRDPFNFIGTLSFTVTPFISGSVSFNGVNLLSVKDSTVSVLDGTASGPHASLSVSSAAFSSSGLDITIDILWTAQDAPEVAWGSWVALGGSGGTPGTRATMAGEYILLSGTALPTNCIWPDGALVDLEEWPDLKEQYELRMLLTTTQANRTAYPAAWVVPDGSTTTLYAPALGNYFMRIWAPSLTATRTAGTSQGFAMQNITGHFTGSRLLSGAPSGSGAFYGATTGTQEPQYNNYSNGGYPLFDASRVVETSAETRPVNATEFRALWLGRHISEV